MNGTNTVRTLQRWWEVQTIFVRYGFDFLVSRASRGQARRLAHARPNEPNLEQLGTPQRLRLMIEELGPTFIKLSQVVSSQTHSIPDEWLQELEKLQDSVPPFSEEEVRATIARELGAQPEYLFRDFTFTPLAAASIGQVHNAVTMHYDVVVVKIQRPNIIPQIAADIAIMREVARTLEATTSWARNYQAVKIVEEFATNLTLELDYCNEARNTDLLRSNMSGIHGIRVPAIHWDLTTSKVLTMERIEGVKVTKVAALSASDADREKMANNFIRAMVKQLLIDGFFHADVHPGNVFIDLRKSEIGLIDVGMAGSLDARQRVGLNNLMRGLGRGDAKQITRVVLALGEPFKPVDEDALERSMDSLLKRHLTGSLETFQYAQFLSEMLGVLFSSGVRVPSDLIFSLKAIMQTEQIVRTLNPKFQITDIARAASAQVLAHELKPASLQASLTKTVEQVFRVAPLLGDAVEQYLYDSKRNNRTTRLDPNDLQQLSRIVTFAVNRLALIVILTAIMLSSILAISIPGGESQSLRMSIGTIGFAISLLLSVVLVILLLWKSWRQ